MFNVNTKKKKKKNSTAPEMNFMREFLLSDSDCASTHQKKKKKVQDLPISLQQLPLHHAPGLGVTSVLPGTCYPSPSSPSTLPGRLETMLSTC